MTAAIRRCPICYSERVLLVRESIYCEECCVYYVIKNGRAQPSALPIKEISQIALELCGRCLERSHRKKYKIRCRNFQGYFSRLPHCKRCKVVNKDFLKNQYYKSFIQYRNKLSAFGWRHLILLALVLYFWSDSVEACVFSMLVIDYRLNRLSYLRILSVLFVAFMFGNFAITRDIISLYCIYQVLFSRMIVFDMPEDLTCHDDLHSLLGRLNISSLDIASDKVSENRQ